MPKTKSHLSCPVCEAMLNILFQVAEKILLFDSTLKFPDSLLQVSLSKFIMIFGMAAMPLPCNGILVVLGNSPRMFLVSSPL